MLRLPPMRQLASLAFVTLCLALPLAVSFDGRHDDLELYGTWANRLGQHVLPYRDYDIEYPPLATLSILVPGVFSTARLGFAVAFVCCMALFDAAGKWVMAQSLPDALRTRFWLVATGLSVVLNYVLLRRFDPAAACCTALALAGCVRRPKSLMPFVWLGFGAAIKLYPIILAPGMLVFAWHQHRAMKAWLLQGTVVGAALCAPSLAAFAWAGPASMAWLRFHQDRGLHTASSLLSWVILWRGGPGVVLKPEFAFGCTQIVGEWSAQLAHLSPKLTLVALCATLAAMWPSLKTPKGLWQLSTALVCALLLTAKVFSPQYMVWLVGLGAMAIAHEKRVSPVLVGSLTLAALATAQLFPGETRIFMGWRSAQWWLIARTMALVVLWGYLARPWQHWRQGETTQRVVDKGASSRQIPLYDN